MKLILLTLGLAIGLAGSAAVAQVFLYGPGASGYGPGFVNGGGPTSGGCSATSLNFTLACNSQYAAVIL